MCKLNKKFKINKQLQCRAQVLTVHRAGVLCILLVVKRVAQTDTGSRLYSNVFWTRVHTQKSEDFETVLEKLTTYSCRRRPEVRVAFNCGSLSKTEAIVGWQNILFCSFILVIIRKLPPRIWRRSLIHQLRFIQRQSTPFILRLRHFLKFLPPDTISLWTFKSHVWKW